LLLENLYEQVNLYSSNEILSLSLSRCLSDCRSLLCEAVDVSQSLAARWKHPLGLSLFEFLTNEQDSHLLMSNLCICNCTWIHVSCAYMRDFYFSCSLCYTRLTNPSSIYLYRIITKSSLVRRYTETNES